MIPTVLLNDLADRIVALDEDDLLSGRDVFAADDDEDRPTAEVFRALTACLDAEVARRNEQSVGLAADPAPLTDFARAVTRLGDCSLNTGIVANSACLTLPASGPVGVMASVVAILAWERRGRRRTYRAFDRDAMSDRVAGWWG